MGILKDTETLSVQLKKYMNSRRNQINTYLRQNLSVTYQRNPFLYEAVGHAVFAIRKRVRPVLTIATAEMFGHNSEVVLPLAASIELVHVSSCIIDDLPSMDNAVLREGKPCTHILFGEATTILAAIALVTNAYKIVAAPEGLERAAFRRRCALVSLLSDTIGGMTSGQLTDLGRAEVSGEALRSTYRQKTGALFEAAISAGAILCAASAKEVEALAQYARCLGVAYQLTDDIRDRSQSPTEAHATHREVEGLMGEGFAALKTLGKDATLLHKIGLHIVEAKSDE